MKLPLLALTLSACSVPDATEQADLVIAVYERDYADLSDTDAECVRDVRVRYAGRPRGWILTRNGAVGHTVTGVASTRVWIDDDLEPQVEAWVLRHEYTHALLDCVEGDPHPDHDVPEFGFAAEVNAPGSLSALADDL